jgi:hypothetical protein
MLELPISLFERCIMDLSLRKRRSARPGTMLAASLLALLLVATPGRAQFRRPALGTTPTAHTAAAFGQSARGFPIFPTVGHGAFTSTVGNGAFTPTARSVFGPTPGSIVPTTISSHSALFGPNGTIIPGSPGFVTTALRTPSPAHFVSDISNPIANPIFSSSPYAHAIRHYDREHWREAAWANSANPYGSFGSYGNANPSSGYGSSSYGSASGSGYQSSPPYPSAANSASAPVATNSYAGTARTSPSDALKAFGIPVEFGEVRWPLALRTMPSDARRELLDKLEAQMTIAASQAINGNTSLVLLRETKNTIESVKWWLRGRRATMPENTYQDGDAFLRQLEESLRRMES